MSKKISICELVLSLFLMTFLVFIVVLPEICQEIRNCKIVYIYAFIFITQIIMCPLLFYLLKKCLTDIENDNICSALMVNILFGMPAFLYSFKYSYTDGTIFQIVNLAFLFIVLCIMCKKIKEVEEINDLSYFKAVNLFIIVIFTAIMFFLKKHPNKEILGGLLSCICPQKDSWDLFKYFCPQEDSRDLLGCFFPDKISDEFKRLYFLIPLTMLQGFYELWSRKSRKPNGTPNSDDNINGQP